MSDDLRADAARRPYLDAEISHLENRPVRALDAVTKESCDVWIVLIGRVAHARAIAHETFGIGRDPYEPAPHADGFALPPRFAFSGAR